MERRRGWRDCEATEGQPTTRQEMMMRLLVHSITAHSETTKNWKLVSSRWTSRTVMAPSRGQVALPQRWRPPWP